MSEQQEWREEESWKQKYQLLADHSSSTIQMLIAQVEDLQEQVESLRCQLEMQQVIIEQPINGNVIGTTRTATVDAPLPQSHGTYSDCVTK